jgi:hypothetical protein
MMKSGYDGLGMLTEWSTQGRNAKFRWRNLLKRSPDRPSDTIKMVTGRYCLPKTSLRVNHTLSPVFNEVSDVAILIPIVVESSSNFLIMPVPIYVAI